jgi:hypothetical protein
LRQKIVRGEGDEAAFGEPRGEVVISGVVAFDHITRNAAPAVLADDDRTPFAGLEVLGKQQYSPGEEFAPDVQDHFVAGPFLLVVDAAGARIGRKQRLVECAEHLFPVIAAIGLGAFDKFCGGVAFAAQVGVPGRTRACSNGFTTLALEFSLQYSPIQPPE